MSKPLALVALVLVGLVTPAMAAESSTPVATVASACDLLSDEEIAAVQGETVSARRGWAATAAGAGALTCHFLLPTSSKSITLMVGSAEGESLGKARQAWKQQFEPPKHRDRGANGHERGEEEEEEEGVQRRPPQKVRSLGDAAYWRATPVGGTLYVLKGRRYFALSVGGLSMPGRELDQVKALARNVLKRL